MEDFGFSTLFNGIDSRESAFLISCAVAIFLLGLLAGFLLRSGAVSRLKRALKASEKELEKAKAENKELRNQLELKEADIQRFKYEINEERDKLARFESERTRYYNEALKIKEELVASESSNQVLAGKLEALSQELSELKSQNDSLKADVFQKDDETDNLAQMQSVFLATKGRLETLETRLSKVEDENEALKVHLQNASSDALSAFDAPAKNGRGFAEDDDYVQDEPDLTEHKDKPVLSEKIDLEEHQKDNLTLIDGIGPFLEKKLNEAGVYTFDQLAVLDAENIPLLTRAIGHIPGRIERDDWVGQAKKLAEIDHATPEEMEHSRSATLDTQPTDLTVIEGIGPILQSILNDAGIKNWQDLAETNDEELRSILLAEGPGYQIIDPASWPAQAQLAINGEWDLLLEYKDEVSGKK